MKWRQGHRAQSAKIADSDDSPGEMSRGEMKEEAAHAPSHAPWPMRDDDKDNEGAPTIALGWSVVTSVSKKGDRGDALDALVLPDAGDLVYAYTKTQYQW